MSTSGLLPAGSSADLSLFGDIHSAAYGGVGKDAATGALHCVATVTCLQQCDALQVITMGRVSN
jgi:hypothetical protein